MRKHLLALSIAAAVAAAAAVTGCDKARPVAAPPAGVTACIGCHGGLAGDTLGAPPRSLDRANPNNEAAGAHRAHLGKDVRCEDCHQVPTRVSDVGHLTVGGTGPDAGLPDTDARAEVPFPSGSRARLAGSVPAWNPTTRTCSGVYCHGAMLANPPPSPAWTTPGPLGCGACHAMPPLSHGAPGSVPQETCTNCHPTTVNADGTIKPGGGHINGVTDVDATNACTACHGNRNRPEVDNINRASPPAGTADSPNPTAEGAHLAHLHEGRIAKAFACSSCHDVPANMNHFQAGTRAEIAFDTNTNAALNLATRDGATPAWNVPAGTCSGVYCHGATLSGGTRKTPVWDGGLSQVGGDGTTLAQRCNVCHGAPPGAPHPTVDRANAPFTQIRQCADCHPGTIAAGAADEINVAGGLHVNGRVDVDNLHPANFATPTVHGPAALDANTGGLGYCKTCHGNNFEVLVGAAPQRSCNTCHQAAGHTDWVNECTFCHGDGARASVGTFPTRGSTAVTLDKAAPPQGTQGETSNSQVQVGAHQAHLGPAGFSKEIQCTECHGTFVPSDTDGAVHANNSVQLSWGALATARGVTPTPAAGNFTNGSAWEQNPNCTNYCHGATLSGGSRPNPLWTETFAPTPCGICHGMRPANWHPNNADCATCHGAGYVALGSTNLATHLNGAINLAGGAATTCTSCHGTPGRTGITGADANVAAAPPVATSGAATGIEVGAHQAHVNQATLRATPLACSSCHVAPTAGAFRHADNNVSMAWSTLASAASASVTPAAGNLDPAWETTPTCTNYCHGNTLGGGTATTPRWSDGAATAAACTSCHGAPPPYAAVGGFHVQNAACGTCHAGATATTLNAAARATHVNGTVNTVALTCATCHTGPTAFAAPFVATTGATASTDNRVGAHAKHLAAGAIAGAFACTACHGAALPGSMGHANGNVAIGWSALAATGTTPTPAAGTIPTDSAVSCANYCHGATLPAAQFGGTNKTPAWTTTFPGGACGTCHFSLTVPTGSTHPTPAGGGNTFASLAACNQCHPDTVTAAGAINVAGGRHINGVLDGGGASHAVPYLPLAHSVAFENRPADCTGCHGANYDTLVGTPPKSCNTCHANPAAFSYVGVPAANWATDCAFCHGNPARAADAAFANTAGPPARSLVQVAPPEALTDGVTSTTVVAVGAHQAHFASTTSPKVQCSACHGGTMPNSLAHMDGTVTLGWSTLATGLGTTTPSPLAFTPVWEAAPTCTNYCHGATLEGGTKKTLGVSWTGGTIEATCGTCHSTPLPYTAASNWHVQNTACGSCHTGYTAGSVNPAVHVNGGTNVVAMTCASCHTLVAGATFTASNGATATSDNRVGAHVTHVTAGPITSGFICQDCHGPFPALAGHPNGAVSIAWSTLASANGTVAVTPPGPTTPTAGALTCANYCHGASLPVADFGGTNKTPGWTTTFADACGTCHFDATPPAAGTRHPRFLSDGTTAINSRTQCINCHPDTVTAAGVINLASGKHLNGSLDGGVAHPVPYAPLAHSVAFEANPAACTSCHGATFGTDVGGGKSCNSCHANPAAFSYVGVANANWATDCTFCHGDPAVAKRSDAAFASVGTPSYSLVAVAPPEALTDGVTGTNVLQVGAHLKHYSTTTAGKVQCTACHGTLVTTLAHVNGVISLGWSTLATANGAVTPTPAAFGAAFATTPTCTNYCHGSTLGGTGTRTTPSWIVPADGACGTCHFASGAAAAGTHVQHVNNAAVLGANYLCADCHTTVVNAANGFVNAALHVNGTENVAIANRGTQASGPYTAASGTCASNYCHSSGQATPTYRTITWGSGALACNGCHGTGNAAGAPDYASGAAGGASANSHAAHVGSPASAATCKTCHFNLVVPAGNAIAGASHTDGTRNVAFEAATAGASATYTAGTKTCSNVSCHGTGTPVWGGGAASVTCKSCHATSGNELEDLGATFWSNGVTATIGNTAWLHSGHGKTTGTFDVTGNPAPNFSLTVSGTTECLYCHDAAVAHETAANPFRLRGASTAASGQVFSAYSTAAPNAVCFNCHRTASNGVDPDGAAAGALRNGTRKMDAAHDGTKHTLATLGGKFCWDCHEPHGDRDSNNTNAGQNIAMIRSQVLQMTDGTHGYLGAAGVQRAVTYNTQAAGGPAAGRIVEATSGPPRIGLCQACHHSAVLDTPLPAATAWTKYWNRNGQDDADGPGAAAPIASVHNGTDTGVPYCVSCHSHGGKFAGGGDCTACHETIQDDPAIPGARRAIGPEFRQAWSHKRSAGGTVTKWDCIVCHMEGDPASGDPLDGTFHKNGVINLRDPDTGLNIKGVAFAAASGTNPGSYSSTATDATFTQFRRNLSNAALEASAQAIMINQCLKCHDADGAASTQARVPVAQMPNASAFKPFGTTIAGAGYTGSYTAGGTAGGVTNINAQFATTNASYHPIRGAQNNWYAKLTRMISPWNGASRSGSVDTASWGPIMTCWDCHSAAGATGLQTASVTAHGGAATLRAAVWSTTSPLCKTCHVAFTSGNAHGTGSAFNSSINSSMNTYIQNQCHYCHASGITIPGGATRSARTTPQAGEDVHGFDRFPPYLGTDTWWPIGATNTYRPFGFMRNAGTGASGGTTNPYNARWTNTAWKPLSGPGVTAGTATCGGTMNSSSCGDDMTSYSPGGVY